MSLTSMGSVVWTLTVLSLAGCGSESITNLYELPDAGAARVTNIYEIEQGRSDAMAMNDGWSASGFIATGGRRATTPNGNLSQASIELDANFDSHLGGSGAEYYTVQLGVNPPASGVFFGEALITWRTQGRIVTRRMSLANGAVLSGTSQACNVKVVDTTDPGLLAALGLSAEPYYVDVLITPGSRPSTQQPPRLLPPIVGAGASAIPGIFVVPGSGTIDIPVQQDAGVISFNASGVIGLPPGAKLSAGDVNIETLIGSTASGTYDLDAIQDSWVPLPPGVSVLRFANNNATGALITMTYGVEG